MFQNGHSKSAQDTQRIQERPQGEAEGERRLFSEACASTRKTYGEQISRLIKFENSSQVKDSILLKANTTQELEEQLLAMYPINTYYIGMRFSHSREGTMNRKFIEGQLDPSEPTVYIKLFLKKHPQVS
jgi:hypothetical protein